MLKLFLNRVVEDLSVRVRDVKVPKVNLLLEHVAEASSLVCINLKAQYFDTRLDKNNFFINNLFSFIISNLLLLKTLHQFTSSC